MLPNVFTAMKTKTIFLLLALTAVFAPKALSADNIYISSGIRYQIIDGWSYAYEGHSVDDASQCAVVVKPTSGAYEGSVTIVSSISYYGKTYPVRAITEDAFDNSTATSITIPASVQIIEKNAFDNADACTTLTFESGTHDLYCAINDYTSGWGAFAFMSSLTTVHLGRTLTYDTGDISYAPFYKNYHITDVRILAGCTSIPAYCFYDNKIARLSFIEAQDLTSIGDYAFAENKITSVNLYSTVSRGSNTFDEGVEVTNTNQMVQDGLRYMVYAAGDYHYRYTDPANGTTYGIQGGQTGLRIALLMSAETGSYTGDITIPEKVYFRGTQYPVCVILSDAFTGCSVTSVTIPNTVEIIEQGAFLDCDNCTSLTFQGGTENSLHCARSNDSHGAFFYMDALNTVYLARTLSYPDNDCSYAPFYKHESGFALTVRSGCTGIPSYCFYDGYLRSVSFDDNCDLATIGSYAFYNCNYVSGTLALPSSVTQIGEQAFRDDTFSSIVFNGSSSAGPLLLGDDVFKNQYTTSIVLDRNLVFTGGSGDAPFYDCDKLTSVTIGSHVTGIPANCFYDCSNLASLNMSDATSLTSIGDLAFYDCDGISSVSISPLVTNIGYRAFYDIEALTSVEFRGADGAPTLTLGENAFYADYITSLSIDREMSFTAESGSSPFYNLDQITSLTIGDHVTRIPDYMFENCDGLGSVVIPSQITSIGDCAFSSCTNLSADLSKATSLATIGEAAFANCDKTTCVRILPNVESIGAQAFYGIDSDYQVIIDESDTPLTLGNSVFQCGSLFTPSVTLVTLNRTLSYTVEFSRDGPFYKCGKLTDVSIGPKVTNLGNYMFYDCDELKNVDLSHATGLTSIGTYTFYHCDKLPVPEMTQATALTSIGNYAFCNCTSSGTVIIPSQVTSIGKEAFYNIESLTGATLLGADEAPVLTLGQNAFCAENLTNLSIDRELSFPASSGSSPFYNLDNLAHLTIGNHMTQIPDYMFESCDGLGSVVIPSQITSIGNYAFYKCEKLQPDLSGATSLLTIGNYAFQDCEAISSITIPASVTSISEGAFYDVNTYYNLNIEDADTPLTIGDYAFQSMSGYEGRTKTLYLGRDLNGTFEDSRKAPFYDCGELTSVTVGPKVTTLNNYLCYNCDKLATLDLSNATGLTAIGDYAFYDADLLESVTISPAVTSIGEKAFYDIEGLHTVSFQGADGAPTLTLGENAFYADYITSLNIDREVSFPSESGSSPFYNLDNLANLTLGNHLTRIPDYMFEDCDGLGKIVVPSQITAIGNYAFYKCGNLSLDLSGATSLLTIGDYAFQDCENIASITILPNVTSIGEGAFYDVNTYYDLNIEDADTPLTIGDYAFQSLLGYEGRTKTLYLGRMLNCSTEADQSAPFYGCGSLTSVTLGSHIRSIADNMFYGCSGLSTLNMTAATAMTSIGENAFRECDQLGSVTINPYVTSIGARAFYGIDAQTTLILTGADDAVELEIGEEAFYDSHLHTLYIDRYVPCPKTQGGSPFYNQDDLTSLTVGSRVGEIQDYMFEDCDGDINVAIGAAIWRIGNYAFLGCTGIKPDFSEATALETIGDNAFEDCSSTRFTSLDLSTCTALTSIGSHAFEDCDYLESITIPGNVVQIGSYAFYDIDGANYSLTLLDGAGALKIKEGAFQSSLGHVNHLSGLYLGRSLHYNGPMSVYGIFYNCDKLTEITVGPSVTYIESFCFKDCSHLSSLNLTNATALQGISGNAFQNCAFESLDFTSTPLTGISQHAFDGCSSLTSLKLPATFETFLREAITNCGGTLQIELQSFPHFYDTWNSGTDVSVSLTLTDAAHPYIDTEKDAAPDFVSLKYIRTPANGKYGTIVLPFVPANADKFRFYTLSDESTDDHLIFQRVASEDLQAGVPYLYRNEDDSQKAEEMVPADGTTAICLDVDNPSQKGNWKFCGTLQATELSGDQYYAISNNRFCNSSASINVAPFRAYFEYVGINLKSALFIDTNDGTTGMYPCLEGDDADGADVIYDLNGLRVDEMQPGQIYLVNGQKTKAL